MSLASQDLRRSNFTSANARKANFKGANLQGAYFMCVPCVIIIICCLQSSEWR